MDAFVQPLYELADFDAIIRQLKKPGIVQFPDAWTPRKLILPMGFSGSFLFD